MKITGCNKFTLFDKTPEPEGGASERSYLYR